MVAVLAHYELCGLEQSLAGQRMQAEEVLVLAGAGQAGLVEQVE